MTFKSPLFMTGAALLALTALNSNAHASRDNSKIRSLALPAPDATEFAAEAKLVGDLGKVDEDSRRPAGGSKMVGSEDLLTPEFKAFRDKLLKCKHAEDLEAVLKEANANYDASPSDLKYAVARISPLMAFRGFFWRMATLAHQAVVTQEVLLNTVRAFAEQVMIFEPNAHWQAYMAFFSIPSAEQLIPPADKHDGVKRTDTRFYVENDLSDFLASEAYEGLATAVRRLAKLDPHVTINGKKSPVVFDGRVRFGEHAFNGNYDAADRFAIIGDAERFAAMARFHRRMATIAQLAAYDLNGNIALRKELGKKYGIDVTLSNVMGGDEALSIDGMTRAERVHTAAKHTKLFKLRNKAWMVTAYRHLNKWAEYANRAWSLVKAEGNDYDMLLDPDMFMGRREQVDKLMETLRHLFPDPEKGGSVATLHGAISGDTAMVDMKSFFFNPPSDLKDLMPTKFNEHEDINGLRAVYPSLKPSRKSTVAMRVAVAGKQRDVVWRNYLYGRATGWNPGAYSTMFPGARSPEGVADAHRVLAETRGGRAVLNTLVVFIK